jgi:crotonobetainyl-CoA:carnitine CoA-transferase CaiB-like acyl-CoA transferase
MTETRRAPELLPLDGVRIVEVGVWHAGPGAAAILADLGADVIKVEPPGGDPERHFGSFGPLDTRTVNRPGWNVLFDVSNRGKRSVVVDLRRAEGRSVLRDLVADADVFLTNLRPESKQAFELGYETLAAVNPQLVHVTVSGFGQHGDLAGIGAYDHLGQAVSGMMYLAGSSEPAPVGTIVLDQLTAITASHAILSALLARQRHGIGQEVHTSLYGAAVWLMHVNLMTSSVLGRSIDVTWDRHTASPLRNTYRCADDRWMVCTSHPESKYWSGFCRAIGRPDLAGELPDDANNVKLIAELDAVFATRPRAEWLTVLQSAGLSFSAVQTFADVLTDPQAIVNGYLRDVQHPILGELMTPGHPVQFGRSSTIAHRPAPELGADTDEVLRAAGYGPLELDRLRERHVVS